MTAQRNSYPANPWNRLHSLWRIGINVSDLLPWAQRIEPQKMSRIGRNRREKLLGHYGLTKPLQARH